MHQCINTWRNCLLWGREVQNSTTQWGGWPILGVVFRWKRFVSWLNWIYCSSTWNMFLFTSQKEAVDHDLVSDNWTSDTKKLSVIRRLWLLVASKPEAIGVKVVEPKISVELEGDTIKSRCICFSCFSCETQYRPNYFLQCLVKLGFGCSHSPGQEIFELEQSNGPRGAHRFSQDKQGGCKSIFGRKCFFLFFSHVTYFDPFPRPLLVCSVFPALWLQQNVAVHGVYERGCKSAI